MKKQFSKLPKAEQEKMELKYHRMKPEEFDEQMAQAIPHTPEALRLPPQLVETLQALAKSEGESGYQPMVRRWIEERLQQEVGMAG